MLGLEYGFGVRVGFRIIFVAGVRIRIRVRVRDTIRVVVRIEATRSGSMLWGLEGGEGEGVTYLLPLFRSAGVC